MVQRAPGYLPVSSAGATLAAGAIRPVIGVEQVELVPVDTMVSRWTYSSELAPTPTTP